MSNDQTLQELLDKQGVSDSVKVYFNIDEFNLTLKCQSTGNTFELNEVRMDMTRNQLNLKILEKLEVEVAEIFIDDSRISNKSFCLTRDQPE